MTDNFFLPEKVLEFGKKEYATDIAGIKIRGAGSAEFDPYPNNQTGLPPIITHVINSLQTNDVIS